MAYVADLCAWFFRLCLAGCWLLLRSLRSCCCCCLRSSATNVVINFWPDRIRYPALNISTAQQDLLLFVVYTHNIQRLQAQNNDEFAVVVLLHRHQPAVVAGAPLRRCAFVADGDPGDRCAVDVPSHRRQRNLRPDQLHPDG